MRPGRSLGGELEHPRAERREDRFLCRCCICIHNPYLWPFPATPLLRGVNMSQAVYDHHYPFVCLFHFSPSPRRASAVVGVKGQMRLLQLVFRDIAGHVAVGKSLVDVGDQIGVPKVGIDGHDKARMDILLAQDKPLFERYAMTDALICATSWCIRRLSCSPRAYLMTKTSCR